MFPQMLKNVADLKSKKDKLQEDIAGPKPAKRKTKSVVSEGEPSAKIPKSEHFYSSLSNSICDPILPA